MEIKLKKAQNTYLIQVRFKKMKRMILRYRQGKYVLSAPMYVSQTALMAWLNGLTIEQLEQLKANVKVKQGSNFVYLFGREYALEEQAGGEPCLTSDSLHIDPRHFEFFLKKTLEDYLFFRIHTFYTQQWIDFMPVIEISSMKSRYGVCYVQRRLLRFSLSLIHEPREVIDSVIIHELGHFYYPNHSQAFYQWVKAHDPDYDIHHIYLKQGGAGRDSIC